MTNNRLSRSTEMELLYEAMARAQVALRMEEAREHRRAAVVARARKLARSAERQARQARLLLASSF
jgi:hypothetical protein